MGPQHPEACAFYVSTEQERYSLLANTVILVEFRIFVAILQMRYVDELD